jgi:hypothetical protein
MKNPILTPEEAIVHVKRQSDFKPNLRAVAVKILHWTIDWNKEQPADSRVLCFLREDVNVGFFLDRDGNREKTRRPNFLVVKARGDYLDFGLGREPDKQYRHLLQQLKDNEIRWLLRRDQFPLVSDDLLRQILVDAIRHQMAD